MLFEDQVSSEANVLNAWSLASGIIWGEELLEMVRVGAS